MSADASPTVTSRKLPAQPAGDGTTTEQVAPCFREACCQELPIRVLGSRAIAGLNGDVLKGEPFEEASVTMLLFPRGAVIRLAAPVAAGHDLMLIDQRTNRHAHCRITNVRTSPDVKSYVELEFTHATSDFWGIAPARERMWGSGAGTAAEQPWPALEKQAPAPEAAPTKALAAAAGAEAARPAYWRGYAVESPTEKPGDTSAALEDEREKLSETPFFAPLPTEALPVSEPVLEQTEAAPTLPQAAKWEAVSKREPRRKGRRRAAVGAVILSAIFFGYRITAPVTLPMAIETVSTTTVEVLPTGIVETAAAVKAGLVNKDWSSSATAAAANAANTAEPLSAPLAAGKADLAKAPVAATPEPPRVAARKHLEVQSGKMIPPVQQIVAEAHSAPELRAGAGQGPGAAAPQLPGEAPGGASGLLTGASVAPPPPAEPVPAADNTDKTTEGVTAALLLTSVAPEYPMLARQAHIEGDVTLEVKLDASGNVIATRVLAGPHMLRTAAATAVAKWKFEPARLRDRATACTTTVTLRFRLK